jgi:hypothetical protein
LAEGGGIGEIRRSIVEIYGGRAGPVNDSEWWNVVAFVTKVNKAVVSFLVVVLLNALSSPVTMERRSELAP